MFFGVRHNVLPKSESRIPNWLLLIGTGFTCSVTQDSNFLSETRFFSKSLGLVVSGVTFDACMKGTLIGKMLEWHSEESVANLLIFEQLAKFFRVACDAQFEHTMWVGVSEGKWMKFSLLCSETCTFDTSDKKYNSREPEFLSWSLVQTSVEKNLKLTQRRCNLLKKIANCKSVLSLCLQKTSRAH